MLDEYDDIKNEEYTQTAAEESAEQAPVTETPSEQIAEEEVPEVQYTDVYSSAPAEETAEMPQAEQPAQEEIPDFHAEKIEQPEPERVYGAPYNQPYQNRQPPYQGAYYPDQAPAEEKPKNNGKKIFFSALALILVFALGVGTASLFKSDKIVSKDDSDTKETYDTAELEIADTPTPKNPLSNGKTLAPSEIAEKVRESNVGIVVYSSGSNSKSGEGSGVIMGTDSTGSYTYIITCAHVINEAGIKANVQTEDGKTYEAEIAGFDTRTDLGVLKIKATGLKAAEFGNSDDLKIGDAVYAVGNPGGVEFFGSFTGGFVSAINRPVSSEIGYTMKCIQHDASINPGNSGGMLVNQYGQVVGINSQKIANTAYEGMGFAIPITSAKTIIDDLIHYSYVPNRPKLGITYYPVSASTQYNMIAQIKGLPAGTLIINEISSDSSLANTDARKYDMIIAVNGQDLTTADVLLEKIDKGKVGDKLTLTLCRVNSNYSVDEFDINVTLVEDKGEAEETTTQAYVNPFDYYFGYGSGNGNGNSGGYYFGN